MPRFTHQLLRRLFTLSIAFAALLLASACVTAGRPDFTSKQCASHFAEQLSDILYSQGESRPVADDLADQATMLLTNGSFSPIDFPVESPSGTQYSFSIHHRSGTCVLRLYYRGRRGFQLTNTITYIATRLLPQCTCRK